MVEVSAEQEGAALAGLLVARVEEGALRVLGPDRRAFLNGLLTADVASLRPGGWTPAYLLTPKGRLVAELSVHDRAEDMLLLTRPCLTPALRQGLAKTLPLTESSIEDADLAAVALLGPRAPDALAVAGLPPEPGGCARGSFEGAAVWACRSRFWGPGWLLLCAPGAAARLEPACLAAVRGARQAAAPVLEGLRAAAGLAAVGVDTDAEAFPLELGAEAGISWDKGCYLGQETTAKMRNLGHPNRALARVRLDGPVEEGCTLSLGAEAVGRATSVSRLAGSGILALALLRRFAASAGTRLCAPGGVTAEVLA